MTNDEGASLRVILFLFIPVSHLTLISPATSEPPRTSRSAPLVPKLQFGNTLSPETPVSRASAGNEPHRQESVNTGRHSTIVEETKYAACSSRDWGRPRIGLVGVAQNWSFRRQCVPKLEF